MDLNELIFLFLNLFTSNFQDFCTTIKHTFLEQEISALEGTLCQLT